MKLEKGTTVSHYRILSEIGKGGMGEVYLAQDTKLNRKVAIKFLSDEFNRDSDKLNRFIQEAQAASALNHPNIVTIHEIGEADDSRYIALEYIEGETLTSFLKKQHKCGSTLDIATQIASALDAAHSAGIVHRDIKPDNVMIRKDGLVKILDFGIAKLAETNSPEIESEDKTAVQVNTTPGMIIGTANYMSPEQAAGKEVDARTDIFSFGVVLYEMMSGRLPFEGGTAMESISSILKDEPKPLSDIEVPADLQKIISKTLRKNRDERYQTIRGLLADLKELKQELEIQDRLDKTVQPDRAEPETQMFKATTAAEAEQTTSSEGVNDSISIKKSSFSKGLIGVATVAVLAAVGFGYWYFSGGGQINSIAVMPFVNQSNNEEIEYLSDGMTESLISSLTEIPNLSVKARSTVFFYKGKNKTPKEIGEELGVEAVLLGRLVQRGDNLKLSLELVNTATLDAVWSQSYDRKMSDLVTLQSEIARNVADKLRLKLTATEQENVARSNTENSEAQKLYLQGLFHFNRRWQRGGDQELVKSAGFFRQAIGKDPDYALAYAGLANAYSLMTYQGPYSSREYLPKAKEAADKALEIDPDLAEAHAALGNILHYSYDWKGAEREYRKAIELDPKYAKAHQWLSDYLAAKRMYDEALKERDKALELDPLDKVTNLTKIANFYDSGQYDKAIIQAKKCSELFPETGLVPDLLSRVYLAKGMELEAMEQYWIALGKYGVPEARIGTLKEAYKKEGLDGLNRKKLEFRLAEVNATLEKDRNAFIEYKVIANAYAEVKDKAKTLEYLNKAYQQREPDLIRVRTNPLFDFLIDEPEFQELLRKINYPGPLD